jgi:hypothetical protein
LRVGDLFKPHDVLTVEVLLKGDMDHPSGWSRAVPVLLTCIDPDGIAGPNLSDRPAPTLKATHAGNDVERLAERVGVPGRSGARLKAHPRPAESSW